MEDSKRGEHKKEIKNKVNKKTVINMVSMNPAISIILYREIGKL